MKIHIFPFSARKGTPAATFADQVSPEVRKARCDRLADLERELALQFYETWQGRELEVLLEQPVEHEPGWYLGTDRRYIPIRMRAENADVGRLLRAVGTAADREGLTAERVV